MTDSPEPEACTHVGHEIHVQIHRFDTPREDVVCSWCGDPEVVGALVKSNRHPLPLCKECDEVLEILYDAGDE